VAAAVQALIGLGGLFGSIPTGSLTAAELEDVVDAFRIGQRHLDGFGVRLGLAAERLAAEDPRHRSASELLLGRTGSVRGSTARRDAARAGVAGTMGNVGAAAEAGLLGGDQLDSLAQATKGLTDEQKAQLDTDELVTAAVDLPADAFHRRLNDAVIALQDDHGLADTKAKQKASSFRHWLDGRSGMGKFSGQLDPERYESLVGAVEAKMAGLAATGGVSKDPNLAATALMDLVTSPDGGSSRAHLTVVVDESTLRNGFHPETVAETGDGHRLPPESVARLACDAVLQRVTLDDRGVPIDVGRRYRTATDAQWHAIRAIYSHCAWHRCDRPLSWCQLHHIHEWEHGGPTDLCNLIPLCNRHHHLVHEGQWRVSLDPNSRCLGIYRPDGSPLATAEPDRRPAGNRIQLE